MALASCSHGLPVDMLPAVDVGIVVLDSADLQIVAIGIAEDDSCLHSQKVPM